jgi:phosphate transport system protein
MTSKHTAKAFDADLNSLKESLLLMGGVVESMLKESHEAFKSRNASLAKLIIARDDDVDRIEKSVDELAIQILALRQPAARDLRFVSTALKISKDLERIGDEVVNICERVAELAEMPESLEFESISKEPLETIFVSAQEVISRALDAFVSLSSQQAGEILKLDDRIDQHYRSFYRDLLQEMQEHPDLIVRIMKILFVAKYLERIADHATNFAEQVIFVVEGLDIRHEEAILPLPE